MVFEMSELPLHNIPVCKRSNDDGTESPNLEEGEIDEADDAINITSNACLQAVPKCEMYSGSSDMDEKQRHKSAQSRDRSIKVASINIPTGFKRQSLSNRTENISSVKDEHASNIEYAIASALKKRGIIPPVPKLFKLYKGDGIAEPTCGQSRSSRRRKRQWQRDELKKTRREKVNLRRNNIELQENITLISTNAKCGPPVDTEDLDDYEILNVRGCSPLSACTASVPAFPSQKYESQDDNSANSFDSHVSHPQFLREGRGRGASRRERVRVREGREKCNRRKSCDRKNQHESQSESSNQHRKEPLKLELCKFYLMECCAKKEKCSYMHSDFPCKYYYLGMDCVYGDMCKFSHGKPLTEQLRNVLLKHLETAPREILGAFKRICRETAISQMTLRHTDLCKKFGIENKLRTLTSTTSTNLSGESAEQYEHPSLPQQQPNQPQIPSLLDIVIKPPIRSENNSQQKDKQRKSRWCDGSNNKNNSGVVETFTCNPMMDLKVLTGMIKEDIIAKLSQVGVVNLEQINELRFGQLAKIGLTIAEINELEISVLKLKKLVENQSSNTKNSIDASDDSKISTIGDTGTLSTPGDLNTCMSVPCAYSRDQPEFSNSNSNSSSNGVVLVDYSQYLKDSNLKFDRGDIFDDDKDEAQLVIDDGLYAGEETHTNEVEMGDVASQTVIDIAKFSSKNDKAPKISVRNLSTQINDERFEKRSLKHNGIELKHDAGNKVGQCSELYIDNFTFFGNVSGTKQISPCSLETPANERSSRYHCDPKLDGNDKLKVDEDKRPNSLSIPFQPVSETEINSSISFNFPISWKLYEVEIPRQSYSGKMFTTDQTMDPRVRRILQLSQLSETYAAAASTHVCTSGTSTMSSENIDNLLSYYTSPGNLIEAHSEGITRNAISSGTGSNIYSTKEKYDRGKICLKNSITDPRVDPRRAAIVATVSQNVSLDTKALITSAAQKQNSEIRNLLQKSDWYKNLSSTSKIMVNQQLALVFSELKKFHQNSSTEKVFDLNFIMCNPTLQQILTSLGICINCKGEISYLEIDHGSMLEKYRSATVSSDLNLMPSNMQQVPYMKQMAKQPSLVPTINRMPPLSFMLQSQLDFLRGPPPNISPPVDGMSYRHNLSQPINFLPSFTIGSPPPPTNMLPITRSGLLGMPRVISPVSDLINQSYPNVTSVTGAPTDVGRGAQEQSMQQNFGSK